MESPITTTRASQSGFAMLFTVLLVSLILSIAVSISNLTLKQAVLSNLAKDSGIAFYQADAAVECAMYQEINGKYPYGKNPSEVPSSFMCGKTTMVIDTGNPVTSASDRDYFVFNQQDPDGSKPCYSIVFDKTKALEQPNGYSRVLGSGRNICRASSRQVERSLEVKY